MSSSSLLGRLLSRNISYSGTLRLTAFRKVALGTWRTVGDPSVYGMIDLEVEPALAYLERIREKTGEKVSMTHFVGRAVAETIKRHPDVNVVLRWSQLYQRETVDVFFQVAADTKGDELSGHTVRRADQRSIAEIAAELNAAATKIRTQNDPAFRQMKNLMRALPSFLARSLINFSEFILMTLNLWTPLMGVPRDAFGSVMVTSIGSLGLDDALAPLVPYSRVPLLISIGRIREMPVVRDGKIVVGQVVRLGVTVDHRAIDGVHASKMAKTLKAVFADPERELGPA
jgi:pyruvate/2-oxoglutarate dehydrogenase complex dihydrolipoamide acyltransferase (E2) component